MRTFGNLGPCVRSARRTKKTRATHKPPNTQPPPAPPPRPAPLLSRSRPGAAALFYHGGACVKPDGPTNGGVHHSGVPQHDGQVKAGFVQSRANNFQTEHQTWTQRGGYNGYRIPDARFHLYFGTNHFFRIGGLPMVFVGGMPRFQYDGFYFTIMDPWPSDWDPNWYADDDVYIDYVGDGYYLFNRNYPGVQLALTVTF